MIFKNNFPRPAGAVSCRQRLKTPLKNLGRNTRLLLCLGLGLWLWPGAEGLRAASPFSVKSWSVEEHLPRSSVISVIQSHDGYLWLATINGLVRFDGNQFTVFNQFNTPGLTSDQIVYLFEDSRSNLWVGTASSGLLKIKDGQVQSFGSDTATAPLTYAYEDHATNVWFWMDGHVLCDHNGQMDFHPPASTQPLLISGQPLLPFLAARIVFPGAGGNLWFIQGGRVGKLDAQGKVSDFGPSPVDAGTIIKAGCEDADGRLILGTLGEGVFWLDNHGKWRHISKAEGLSSDYVLSLCLDREGDLWVGTDGGGVDRIQRKIFSTPDATHSWSLESLSHDTNGGVWMAYNFHGLSYWQAGSNQDYQIGNTKNAWSVLVDRQQHVWAGSRDGGLFTFTAGYYFRPVEDTQFLGPQINGLFQGRDGTVWVATPRGLGSWDGKNWKMYTDHDGLPDDSIRALTEDTRGNLWVGTDGHGLANFKDGKFSVIHAGRDSIPGDDISCLFGDGAGDLWVGTLGHGLGWWHGGKWYQFATTNGLAGNSIAFVTEDEVSFWIGSNAGLMRVAKKSFADLLAGEVDSLSCRIYTSADGLPTSECSFGSQPATSRAPDGQLWFPTAQGAAVVNPAGIRQNSEPPPVMIESVLIDGVEQKTNQLSPVWSQSIVLQPWNEQLEIHYTSLNLAAPDRTRFKYWLENHEKTWTDAGYDRVARFPKLPPGEYRFHVKAVNEDGAWSSSDSLLAITVRPPFWETKWFITLSFLSLVGIIAGTVHLVSTAKLRRRIRQQESLEKERSRIARDLHDQLGANLTQVTLLGEMTEADKNLPDEVEYNAKQICATARETTRALDEIVWAVNPANDTLEGLANYACKYAQDYFALAGLRYRVDVPAQLPPVPLPPEVRHNVFLAFKEAVNNVVKHAQASEAHVRLQLEDSRFVLAVQDNGRGLGNLEGARLRNGLKNMRKRLTDAGGEFAIGPAADGGTLVTLSVPLNGKSGKPAA